MLYNHLWQSDPLLTQIVWYLHSIANVVGKKIKLYLKKEKSLFHSRSEPVWPFVQPLCFWWLLSCLCLWEHAGLQKWVEVGNSGVFRPEMLLPMGLPEDVSVIAWGLSLERWPRSPLLSVLGSMHLFEATMTEIQTFFLKLRSYIKLSESSDLVWFFLEAHDFGFVLCPTRFKWSYQS